jgi:DNA-binding transcriptional ArsR family regulator
MRVVDLAAAQTISRPAVSRHLRLLSDAGLLEVAAHGRERHYRLRVDPLGQIRDFVDQLLQVSPRVTDQMLDALGTEVRRASRDRRRATRPTSRDTTRATAKEETA